MPQPTAIWTDSHGRGRNRYALFRHSFELPGEPACGRLHVFADSRYRLAVNGHVLGHGPARFFAVRPEYDTVDLTPALGRGRNAIAVTVNSAGAVSFHSEASVGGLIAWGSASDAEGNTVEVRTDESWRAIDSPGHRCDTHCLSFALNPAEHLDARAMPAGWQEPDFDDRDWPHAVLHGRPDHWADLDPRSIPLLDEREVRPRRRLGAWIARDDPAEEIHSLIAVAKGGRSLHTNSRVAVLTHIHSPRGQTVAFGAWWGRFWMNGQPLEPVPRDDMAMRQDFTAALNAFYYRALGDAARIMAVVGRERTAADCRRRAAAVAQAIRREFWDGERGVYVDLRRGGATDSGPSVATNALVLLYDIGEPGQAASVVAWVADAMRHDARAAEGQSWGSYNVSSYFSFYALGALYRHGRAADAEAFIRAEWGRMLDAGAWTCWEHFADTGGRCHAWSSAPTYYLSSRVLGVQQPEPGNPSRVHIAPTPGTLEWAAGVWPHPAGPIRIAWRRAAGKLLLDYSAPDALDVTTDPATVL